MKLRELKQGQLFTLKDIAVPNENQVFVRKEFDRSEKKYLVQRYSDINSWRYLSGDRKVFVDFIF